MVKNTGPTTLPDFQVFVANPNFWVLGEQTQEYKGGKTF